MRWTYGLAFGSVLAMMSLLAVVIPGRAQQDLGYDDYQQTLVRIVGEAVDVRQFAVNDPALFRALGDYGDPLYIAPLLDASYFLRGNEAMNIALDAVAKLSGETRGQSWEAYYVWASENDIELPPYYDEFKGLLMSVFIDPEFARFFAPGSQASANVNMLEAVWGGVRVDGIPSLVNSPQITPQQAAAEGDVLEQYCRGDDCSYPAVDELVFGVALDGDARAYPLRILNWHEMFNDVIGHTPLLDAPNGEQLCNFRAGIEFRARARSGDDFIWIGGTSPDCADEGWIAVEAAQWRDGDGEWDNIRDLLPDVAAEEEPMSVEVGYRGSVAGRPVMLAYCTLCGSGILYDVTIPELSYTDLEGNEVNLGETVLEFGSTGMLMRSNKLMYDRTTDTVWNALTGVPAFGPLANSDLELDLLPVVVTDWGTWLEEHPHTSVLSLETGVRRDYTNGAAYENYFNDSDFVMFPVWQQDQERAEVKEMVFGLRLGGEQKAYLLDALIAETVTNDTFAGQDLVIVSRATPDRDFFEPGGAAVRAYASNGSTFNATDSENELVDDEGTLWTVTEDALISEDGDELERVAGHLAFWFGWFSFYPDTQFYESAEA